MPSLQKALLCLTDVLIINQSCTVHGFENARYAVREREEEEEAEGQDRVDTTFKLNVKGTTIFASLALIGRITSEAGPDTGQSLLHVEILCRITSINKYLFLPILLFEYA